MRKNLIAARCLICDLGMYQQNDCVGRPLCGSCFKKLTDFADETDSSLMPGFALLALKNETNKGVSEKIKAALKAAKLAGKKLGRPQTTDYSLILKARSEGLSYREISKKHGVSQGSIQRALNKP